MKYIHKIPLIKSGQNEEEYKFINVFEHPEMVIGSIDFTKTGSMSKYIYEKKMVPTVRNSMFCSGGLQIRFITDSPRLIVKFCIDNKLDGNVQHTGVCARLGISILVRPINLTSWKVLDITGGRDEGFLCVNPSIYVKNMKYEVCITLPLLARICGLTVGIKKGCEISENTELLKSPAMVFLGSYFFYGIGITGSGSMISNAISRRINCRTYNLAVNSENYFNYDMSDLISKIDNIKGIVIECDRYNQDIDAFYKNFRGFIESIMKKNNCPIIFMNQIYTGSYNKQYRERKEYILNIVKEFNKLYANRIYFIDGETILTARDRDLCSYSHNYLNSYASLQIVKCLTRILKEKINTL